MNNELTVKQIERLILREFSETDLKKLNISSIQTWAESIFSALQSAPSWYWLNRKQEDWILNVLFEELKMQIR